MLAFFGGIGPTEMLVVGVVAVLLFGSRLPLVARSAGKSLTEFRRGMQDLQDEFRDAMHEAERVATDPPQLTQARGQAEPEPSADALIDEASPDSEDEGAALVGEGYPEPTRPPYES